MGNKKQKMEYSHEIIMPNDDIPFKMFIFEGKDGNYVREKHWHRSIEIFALFEGELEFYVNEKRYPLKPGDRKRRKTEENNQQSKNDKFMRFDIGKRTELDSCAADSAFYI